MFEKAQISRPVSMKRTLQRNSWILTPLASIFARWCVEMFRYTFTGIRIRIEIAPTPPQRHGPKKWQTGNNCLIFPNASLNQIIERKKERVQRPSLEIHMNKRSRLARTLISTKKDCTKIAINFESCRVREKIETVAACYVYFWARHHVWIANTCQSKFHDNQTLQMSKFVSIFYYLQWPSSMAQFSIVETNCAKHSFSPNETESN